LIRFTALSSVPSLPRPTALKIPLQIFFAQNHAWRTTVHNTPNGWAMALAKARHSEQKSGSISWHSGNVAYKSIKAINKQKLSQWASKPSYFPK
jgi:hypothetical protein